MTPSEKGLLNFIVKGSVIIALSGCVVAFLPGLSDDGKYLAMGSQIAMWSSLWHCSKKTARIDPQRVKIQLSVFAAAFSLILVSSVAESVFSGDGYTWYLKYWSMLVDSLIMPMPEVLVLVAIFFCIVLYRFIYALMTVAFGLYSPTSVPYATITDVLATLAAKGFSACGGGMSALGITGYFVRFSQLPAQESVGLLLGGVSMLGVPAFAKLCFDACEFVRARFGYGTGVFNKSFTFAIRNMK